MANLSVRTFNAGLLTPLIDTRSDVAKYASGCRILDNMIPVVYGPAVRRPGTKYINNVDDDDVKSRMVSFIFSATIAYKLEFSDQIINVYFGDTLVDADIATPYLEADLFALQIKQSADVMWIDHPSYAPRKLSRVSVTEFTLTTTIFNKGPFIERNDIVEDDDITIKAIGYTIGVATAGVDGVGSFTIENATTLSVLFPANTRLYVTDSTGNDGAYTVSATNATTYVGTTQTVFCNETIPDGTNDGEIMVAGGTVTLTASAATFNVSDHVGTLFKLTEKRVLTATSGSIAATGTIGQAIDVKGTASFNTSGNWDGTVEIQRNEDGTNWETYRSYLSVITNGVGSRNIQQAIDEEADNVQYRINVTAYTAGTINADIIVTKSTQDSIFRITAVASTLSATATAVVAAGSNAVTKRWAEGAWSAVRGYPSAITFFGERAVYGFTNSDQQTIWLSEVGRFEDFEAGVKDSDSFALMLPTANRGRWLGSLETLAAGTTGDEWRIRASNLDQALTPTNFDIKKQTNFGGANIQAMEVNEAILFVDYVARKVREYTFSDPTQKYVSPDLTVLAENVTLGGITSLAVQKNPDPIIWFTIAASPYLLSMTYEREQDVVAWARHPLGGDGIAESVCVTPSTSEDVITFSVKRTINGSTVRFIEEMQPRNWGSDDTDAYFVDAGVIDTGGDTTVEIAHLEGETVSVLVDGALQTSKVVSGGVITIDKAGTTVHAGLPSTYQLSPMRLVADTQAGTSLGSITKVSEVIVSLYKSLNVKIGDGIDEYDLDWRSTEVYDSPPNLFTGMVIVSHDGGFNTESNIVISGSDPFPCTIRAIIARIEKTGR